MLLVPVKCISIGSINLDARFNIYHVDEPAAQPSSSLPEDVELGDKPQRETADEMELDDEPQGETGEDMDVDDEEQEQVEEMGGMTELA